ncbi:MAG: hypothetical protein J6C84_03695 [Lachnospiraceae bacterium]|nr:hypothetical protein [Lachnospiraceae bacterium]
MSVSCEKVMIFLLLFAGFLILFYRIRVLGTLGRVLKRTRDGMQEASRHRILENRRSLRELKREHSLWHYWEQLLWYSGAKRRFPFLDAGWLLVVGLAAEGGAVILGIVFGDLKAAIPAALLPALLFVLLQAGRVRAGRSVNDNLLKFLDFLGNYSITSGEIAGIFQQISRYMEEPLKGALEECCYEAQTTGDTGLALLSMAEKIEHPKFKEFVRNMEINLRYCADFSVLVAAGRRSVRDYLKAESQRRSMLREGAVNLLLLLAMSVFVLLTVDRLIEVSVWKILWDTLPGRLALAAAIGILLLFLGQLAGAER